MPVLAPAFLAAALLAAASAAQAAPFAITYQGTYVGNLRELQELMQLVKDKQLQSVPTTCMHFSKAFTALLALEEGKAVGRQILTPEGA